MCQVRHFLRSTTGWVEGDPAILGLDQVHSIEIGMFTPGHNAQRVWFYAHYDGYSRYVEMGWY